MPSRVGFGGRRKRRDSDDVHDIVCELFMTANKFIRRRAGDVDIWKFYGYSDADQPPDTR